MIEFFKKLYEGCLPDNSSYPIASDHALNQINYKHFPKLHDIQEKLKLKSRDKTLDIIFRIRLLGMVGTLNLYLDPELTYTWREASLIAAKSQGRGLHHVRNLRT